MKYLGIDYGSKRIGLAISDENGSVAFPKEVLLNDKNVISKIKEICQKDLVGVIVLGESVNYSGGKNAIMKKIEAFKNILELETSLPIFLEPEFMTSIEAERLQGKNEKLDASAAAIILKYYLDKINLNKK